jgi:hypothetical protein
MGSSGGGRVEIVESVVINEIEPAEFLAERRNLEDGPLLDLSITVDELRKHIDHLARPPEKLSAPAQNVTSQPIESGCARVIKCGSFSGMWR